MNTSDNKLQTTGTPKEAGIAESDQATEAAKAEDPRLDRRTLTNVAGLHPRVRDLAKRLVLDAIENGIEIRVISGMRTYEEQDDLYAQGRTKPGKIVTHKRGGYSNHNFGLAFDIGVFEGAKYIEESPAYKRVGVLGEALGLEWGGRWEFVDEPHFQYRPQWALSYSAEDYLAALRIKVANHEDLIS